MSILFEPISIGSIEAKNHVFMAPMTRARATREHVPTPIMVEYYTQRASAGLIVTEGTGISREGLGWPYAPGIWSEEQVQAWRPIVDSVHQHGGRIVSQLWHMGRGVHSTVSGVLPVSASNTSNPVALHTYDGKLPPEQARALSKEDIQRVTNEYAAAARNAIAAGFDGVQIHAANGYLIDQFLKDSSNLRDDEYGGSIENRIRFLDEVVGAVVAAVGPERTGVRFSPNGESAGVIDSNPERLYVAVAQALNKHHVSWVELREPNPKSRFGGFGGTDQLPIHDSFRSVFKGKLVLNQEYTRAKAEETILSGTADAISFGRLFIANPNLVEKLRENKSTAVEGDESRWWYLQGREGYTDWGN